MKKIFCLGNVSYDILFRIPTYQKENTKSTIFQKIECAGGSNVNCAIMLSLWKQKTYFVGTVGDDYYGDCILDSFTLFKVNTKYLNMRKNYNTSTSVILCSEDNGKRTITTFFDNNKKSIKPKNITETADVILVDGYEFETAMLIMHENKKAIKILNAERVSDEIFMLSKLSDYVICSLDFIREYKNMNVNPKDIDLLNEIYIELEEKFNSKIIFTLEQYGSYTKINNEYKIIPSIKVKQIDSTGAGDIFRAAFTFFIINKYDYERSIKLANIAGAISVTRIGARFSIPTLDEVLANE